MVLSRSVRRRDEVQYTIRYSVGSALLSNSLKVLLTLSYFSLLPQNSNNKKKWGGDGFYREDRGCQKVM